MSGPLPAVRVRSGLVAGLAALVTLAGWAGLHHAQGFSRGPATRFANGRPDTTLVWGPEQVTSANATQWTTEVHTVTIPGFDAAKRYYFRITNGDTASGANRVSQVSLLVDGKEFMSASDVTSSVSACNKIVTVSSTSTFQLGVKGAVGRYAKFRLYSVPDPSYAIDGGSYVIQTEDGFAVFTETVDKSANASAPWTLTVENGYPDGTSRCTGVRVQLNGTWVIPASLVGSGTASVTRQVSLLATNNVTVRLYGELNARATLTWAATDTTAPSMVLVRPTQAYVTDSATVATTATLADQTSPLSVVVHTLPAFNTTAGFTVAAPLPVDGLYSFKVKVTDRAGYSTEITRHVIRDSQAPVLTVNSPPDPPMVTTNESVAVSGAWSDTSITTVTVDGTAVGTPDSSGVFSLTVPLDVGPNGILFRARDALGRLTQFKRYVLRELVNEPTPRDSNQISLTQLPETEVNEFRDRVRFLFNGVNAYQGGASLDTMALQSGREAVVRGRVLARDFGPIANVSVRVLDHPEYGESVTRADGSYSLVVNGGTALVLRYLKGEYLESQRRVEVPAQDFALLEDVAMIGRSGLSYQVNNAAPTTVVGRFESDANGDRRLWMLVPQGTVASVTPSGGTPITYNNFQIRLKEFTVGSSGDESMPGSLPPSTAYTYCVGVSLVEAESIHAAQPFGTPAPDITFDRPIVTYTREFLGVPVGTSVPSGVYDSRKGQWVAREDGCVVRVLAPSGGLANLDTNGDGQADGQPRLDSLGIDNAERAQLVPLFAPGDSLWRVRVDHFSAVDFNYNEAANASAASSNAARAGLASSLVDDPSCSVGCIIENENRVLGETIPLRGVPYALHYRSSRQAGDRAMRWIRVPLIGATKPPELERVYLTVDVAGRRFKYDWAGSGLGTDHIHVFRDWDGTDVFGRRVNGSITATVRIGYEFPALYARATSNGRSFGNSATIPATGGGARTGDRPAFRTQWTTQQVSVGAPGTASAGLGGWTITPHHFYDRNGRGTVYFGDGSMRIATRNYPIILNFAGNGQPSSQFSPPVEGASATSGAISPHDIAFAPDGSLILTDFGLGRIVQIKDGQYHLLAGGGTNYTPTDGAPAVGQGLSGVRGIAVAPDGTIYFAASGQRAVFKVTATGLLYRVAGTLSQTLGSNNEDTLATDRRLPEPISVAVGPDGSLFIGDSDLDRVLRVGTDGRIRTYAGNGGLTGGEVTTEGKATEIPMHEAFDLDVDGEGNLFIAEQGNDRIRRVSSDGRMTTVKHLGGHPDHLDIAPDGSLLVFTSNTREVVRIEPDGAITTLAGGYGSGNDLNRPGQALGYARAATFAPPAGIALGPDGGVYVGEIGSVSDGIRRILSDLPGTVAGEVAFPSEDGRQVFHFTTSGRHLRTMDAVTGDTLYSFGYLNGRVVTIRDANDQVTSIERDGSGTPTKIVGPYQAENLLTVTSKYLTEVRNTGIAPAETYSLGYESGPDAEGLLRMFTNPRGKTQTFTYALGTGSGDDGRLVSDRDAAGGTQTFTHVDQGVVRTVTRTSATVPARVTKYEIREMLDGLRRRFTWRPDLSRTTVVDSMHIQVSQPPLGERIVSTGAAGEVTATTPVRDGRFGMLAKVPATVTTTLPSGLARSVNSTRSYGTNGTVTETVSLNGDSPFTSIYNGGARTLTTTTPESRTSTVTLDQAGRPMNVQLGNLASVSLGYDSRGKLTQLSQGNRGWRYSYDALGRLDVVSDSLHRVTRYFYDGADRVTSQQLPAGHVVGYGYDLNGNLTGLTPPEASPHQFLYTDVDLNERYTPPPLAGIADPATRHEFNLDRQLEKVTRPDGGIVDLQYGATSGRLEAIVHPRGTNTFTYWDTPQPGTTVRSGQLKTVTSSADGVTVSYAHDGPLLASETWSGTVSGSVEHHYDRAFRDSLERVVVGSTTDTVGFAHDRDGLLVQAGPMAVTRAPQTGRVEGTSVGQVTSTSGYNSHGELTELEYEIAGTPYFHQLLERDVLGRVTRNDETWQGTTTSRTYEYDVAGRLKKVMDGAGVQLRRYEYDNLALGNGNRTAERGPADALIAGAGYDAQDRLLAYGAASYSYTAAGELTVRARPADTLSTTYDALGNLVAASYREVSPGTVNKSLSYRVDGQNRRVEKRVDGVPVQGWLYRNGLNPVAELDGTGALKHRYVHATQGHVPDLVMHADTAYRMVTDHLGSVRAVVRTTDGVVVQRLDYDAWGVPTLEVGAEFQSLGYAGGITDRDTKLIRFGARDYEPGVGRWTSKDPIGFDGGLLGLYSYVGDQPISKIDPLGLAHFAKRPLTGWPAAIADQGGLMDMCNCEAVHEELFFDDGTGEHVGGQPGEDGPVRDPGYPRNKGRYVPIPGWYDDDIMREVVTATATGEWQPFGNQCQNWATRWRIEYYKLLIKRWLERARAGR